MNAVELSIFCGAVLTGLVGVFHLFFYRIFGWRDEFSSLTEVSRRILYTIHLALTFFFFLPVAIGVIFFRRIAAGETWGLVFLLFMSCLWLWRLGHQIFYFFPILGTVKRSLRFLHYFLIVYLSVSVATYIYPLLVITK